MSKPTMEKQVVEGQAEPIVPVAIDKEANTGIAVAVAVVGAKRPAEEEAGTKEAETKDTETKEPGTEDAGVAEEVASKSNDHISKKLRLDPAAPATPTPATPAENPDQPPVILHPSKVIMPDIQDESRVKEEDAADDESRKEGGQENQPPALNRSTSGDSDGHPSVTGGANPTDAPDDDDSDSERPLDLASMNAFEYERVVSSNPAALRRYEQYRRSDLKNVKVKRVLQALNPSLAKVNEPYVIAVKGLAKMFVGDVTEMAVRVRLERGEKGALQPAHLREAYRRLRLNSVFPSPQERSVSFT